jgi:hypothetical protein
MMVIRITQALERAAPVVTAVGLILGNVGLLAKRGLHPSLETAVGFLWIASDYALRQKSRHPVAAPRLNGAGIVAGSLLLSLSGIHTNGIDWPRVRSPLGYIPAAAIVGFQREIREGGEEFATSGRAVVRACGRIARYPYTLAALINSYGVVELTRSALHLQDRGLLATCTAYAVATVFLPFLDAGRNA